MSTTEYEIKKLREWLQLVIDLSTLEDTSLEDKEMLAQDKKFLILELKVRGSGPTSFTMHADSGLLEE